MENDWMTDTCIEKELDGRNYYLYRYGKSSQKITNILLGNYAESKRCG